MYFLDVSDVSRQTAWRWAEVFARNVAKTHGLVEKNPQFVDLLSMNGFCLFKHFYAAFFSIKTCFYELAMLLISESRRIFTKLLAVSESLIKTKVKLLWTFSVILLTSAVICKERPFHGNEIVQYFQNYKYYDVGQDHFSKYL